MNRDLFALAAAYVPWGDGDQHAHLITSPDHAMELKGKTLGTTDWWTLDQPQIDLFNRLDEIASPWTRATGEAQSRPRPVSESSINQYLLWLVVGPLQSQLVRASAGSVTMAIVQSVHYPALAGIGSRLIGVAVLSEIGRLGMDGVLLHVRFQVKAGTHIEPACVADVSLRCQF